MQRCGKGPGMRILVLAHVVLGVRSGDGQCIQGNVRRTLAFGSLEILTPYLQHTYVSLDVAHGIGSMYDERCD